MSTYPQLPGWKEPTTSRDAALAMHVPAKNLRDKVLATISQDGPITADAVAIRLQRSILSVRPRVSELHKLGLIAPTGERGQNESGMSASSGERPMSDPLDHTERPELLGSVVRNGGGETLLIPEAELREIDKLADSPLCERCSKPFQSRKGSGGKPQRFCSSECRQSFHSEGQRSQRSPTWVAKPPAVISPAPKPAQDDADAFAELPPGGCWGVPRQDLIECSLTNDDTVEIEEYSPIHPDENVKIVVARRNAVTLARSILFAAGFRVVNIATRNSKRQGYFDVEDGNVPEDFE